MANDDSINKTPPVQSMPAGRSVPEGRNVLTIVMWTNMIFSGLCWILAMMQMSITFASQGTILLEIGPLGAGWTTFYVLFSTFAAPILVAVCERHLVVRWKD